MRKRSFYEIQSTRPTIEQLKHINRMPAVAVLDDIRSMHNVGAIFRTADGVHLQKLYLCGITAKPPRDEIRKTSLGAEEAVPWVYNPQSEYLVQDLSQKGYQIISLEHTTGSVDYRLADYRFPICLVVGHEFKGVNESLIQRSDLAIEIPMRGIKQSLNVSVAFGIAIYEILRHWNLQTKNTGN